ncbi:reverse transcriptase domain-containing protein [Tanacetum coccineum]
MTLDRIATASKEVEELKKVGILREPRYQTWVANIVMVKKTDRAWRTCVDFININKACPKDCYSLLEINWKVDSLFDFKLKYFLDAYKGYHQIQMAKEDKHKTNFHAHIGYIVTGRCPSGVLSKDKHETQPEEVLFRDVKRPIPGARGVKVRFLSKSVEKSLLLFKALKGCLEKKDFTWTREADKAFEEMKRYIEKVAHSQHEIEFKPRNAVKAQILTDFLIETKKEDKETDFQEQQLEGQNTRWKLYTDGASSGDGSGAGLMIVNPEGTKFTYALKFEFTATNNEAEYEAVIAGLRIAKEMKIEEITVFVDSQLVANQVNGLYEAKHNHTR